jgi:hypothetical protein
MIEQAHKMKTILLNDYLNVKNPWTLRLLGKTDFKKHRDIHQVENEYNLDKYAKLLKCDLKTIEEYKAQEFAFAGWNQNSEMIISSGETIFSVPVSEARSLFYNLIREKVTQYASKHICELGCGYGFNLTLFGKNTYGGEYSENAVTLAKKLGMDVKPFNYYKSEDYQFIRPDTTIFTSHSIEQIPDASVIIKCLEKQKEKINYVVHFEPTIVEERISLFGLLRNRYIEINDYNRNLIAVLQNHPGIEILELKTDVLGLSPLNSTNLIVWKFRN